jgi:hypothetical protein
MHKKILLSFLIFGFLIPLTSTAKMIELAKLADAKVFALYNDDYPAVVNYFTRASEQQTIEFYQQHYGEPVAQERKRGRLTLVFHHENEEIRVVLSHQNNRLQVDMLATQLTKQ